VIRDDEQVLLVDDAGRPTGEAAREAVHGNPSLVHATVHVLVRTRAGAFVLQKRSAAKDVFPGRWDSSVGGHLVPGETPEEAARREMEEELGIPRETPLSPAGTYVFRGEHESEFVTSFDCRYDGPFAPDPREVEEIRIFTREDIAASLGKGLFTPHFEREIRERWGAAA